VYVPVYLRRLGIKYATQLFGIGFYILPEGIGISS
jgi:hypothetical protein